MRNLDLSVVVVNYNTKELTTRCVFSILNHTRHISYEIVLVDNCSNDGSVEMFKNIVKKHKCIVLIGNKKNLGFAGGNNSGVKKGKGRYILLLNSDTYLSEDSLGKVVKFMDDNTQMGIATCMLKNLDGSVQATGGFFPTLPRVFAWMFFIDDIAGIWHILGSVHPKGSSSFFKRDHEQDWATGAFFMIRREVIGDIGLLDEDYFMYMEDVDYCWRARREGWRVFYTTKTSIAHIGGASGGSENTIVSEFKNLKLFYKKYMPTWEIPVLCLVLKIGAALRMLLFGIMLGRKEKLAIYAKAFAAV